MFSLLLPLKLLVTIAAVFCVASRYRLEFCVLDEVSERLLLLMASVPV